MAKKDSNVKKVCSKKKINHYTKAECEAELKRLETSFKNKRGEVIPDANSKYYQDVKNRNNRLAMAELQKIKVP